MRTPDGVSDEIASTLPVASLAADAALHKIGIGAGDTVLIGGAGGGVGVFAVQLARLMGARVIGTGSHSSFEFLRQLGAEPVAYGPGLADRVRAIAPEGVSAATSLVGIETIDAALELGVSPDRIPRSPQDRTLPGVRRPPVVSRPRPVPSNASPTPSLPVRSPSRSPPATRSNKSGTPSPCKRTDMSMGKSSSPTDTERGKAKQRRDPLSGREVVTRLMNQLTRSGFLVSRC